jgi:predicted nucleic acid-binding protein
VEYLRGRDEAVCAALRHVIRNEQVALAGVVLVELLQGCRTEKESGAILTQVTGLGFLETSFAI